LHPYTSHLDLIGVGDARDNDKVALDCIYGRLCVVSVVDQKRQSCAHWVQTVPTESNDLLLFKHTSNKELPLLKQSLVSLLSTMRSNNPCTKPIVDTCPPIPHKFFLNSLLTQ
jgi:hypothetical protein